MLQLIKSALFDSITCFDIKCELIEVKRSMRPFETNKNSRTKLNALISLETKTIHKISSKL